VKEEGYVLTRYVAFSTHRFPEGTCHVHLHTSFSDWKPAVAPSWDGHCWVFDISTIDSGRGFDFKFVLELNGYHWMAGWNQRMRPGEMQRLYTDDSVRFESP
jgi:hypothetical protein